MRRTAWILLAGLAVLLAPAGVLGAGPSAATPSHSPVASRAPASSTPPSRVPSTAAPSGSVPSGSTAPVSSAGPSGSAGPSQTPATGSDAPSSSIDPAAFPSPVDGTAVYDFAGIWTPDTIAEAESLVEALRNDTGTPIAVVSRPTGLASVTEAQAIGDAALLMRRWGVGNAGQNDGLVVLFDLDTTLHHGQIRIYPGSDLEAGAMPPELAQQIFDDTMRPLAVEGDFDGALLAGLNAIDSTLRGGAPPEATDGGAVVAPPFVDATFDPFPTFDPGGPAPFVSGDPSSGFGGLFILFLIGGGILLVVGAVVNGGGRGGGSGGGRGSGGSGGGVRRVAPGRPGAVGPVPWIWNDRDGGGAGFPGAGSGFPGGGAPGGGAPGGGAPGGGGGFGGGGGGGGSGGGGGGF